MDDVTLHTLIREKLRDSRLPLDDMQRFWGGPADREVCNACDQPITKQQLVMEGIAPTHTDEKSIQFLQFHVKCFYIWDAERRAAKCGRPAPPGRRAPPISGPSDRRC